MQTVAQSHRGRTKFTTEGNAAHALLTHGDTSFYGEAPFFHDQTWCSAVGGHQHNGPSPQADVGDQLQQLSERPWKPSAHWAPCARSPSSLVPSRGSVG